MNTKQTANAHLYRSYLAMDRVTKRLAACGVEVERFAFEGQGIRLGEDFWRSRVEYELDNNEVPTLYKYGAIQVYIDSFDDYSLGQVERETAAQERREQLIRDYVSQFPDTIVARYNDGQTYLFNENEYDGFGVTVNVGRALCERVLVGEDVSEVPDPELAQQALSDVPMVKKVTPRYEWRCNDAELSGATS